jgi:hypothetical protein
MLPPVEIAVGALLVTGLGGAWAVIAAAALLVAFSVLLIDRLRQGRRVPCACFGPGVRPISWWSVARNGVLLALAAVALLA